MLMKIKSRPVIAAWLVAASCFALSRNNIVWPREAPPGTWSAPGGAVGIHKGRAMHDGTPARNKVPEDGE
jgi:hypothetical protein